jgi:hypothetical protein
MQRRAAAIYVAFFLVVGAASYTLIATAQEPTVSFENPDYSLSQGDTFSIAGQQYTATEVQTEVEEGGGGGHGGGGGAEIVHSATFAWTNQSARYTETWENNATVTYENDEWVVVIPNESDPTSFTLRESIDRAGILANDTAADNETVVRGGQEYVVVTENGSASLVPASEYFPDPQERGFGEDEPIQFRGNQTQVAVTNESVTLSWTAPRQNTVQVGDRANATLGGQTYLAVFTSNDTVALTQDFENYRAQTAEIDSFHKQKNGLWGITILSGLSVVFLVGLAYLPSRY